MPRTKKFSMDGEEFVITPLTVTQFETWQKNSAAQQENGSASNLIAVLTPQLRDVICPSLNNALSNDADKWTVEKCLDSFDQMLAMALYSAILEFTGLTVSSNGNQAQGEAQAPSTSQLSAGA